MRYLLLFFLLSSNVFSTTLGLTYLVIPTYFHSDMGEEIIQSRVPFVSSFSKPDALFAAMDDPYIPHHDKSWSERTDANVVSIYGIKLDFLYPDDSEDNILRIDTSKASKPDDMPFTIAEVIESIKACAQTNYPSDWEGKLRFEILSLKK